MRASFPSALPAKSLARTAPGEDLLRRLQSREQCWAPIGRLYENREYGKALREISNLLDQINQYIDEHRPWELAKAPGSDSKLHEVCSTALAMFWYTSILLSPVLPETAVKVREFLNLSPEQMKWGKMHSFRPATSSTRTRIS